MGGLGGALEGLIHWVRAEPALALVLLLTLNGVSLLLAVLALARVGKLARRQAIMLRGVDGASLERLLMDYSVSSTQLREKLDQALAMGESNAHALRNTPRRIGMIRYDAFTNVGGLQSFSFALLDEQSNGIVLSGLYSRNDVRVYAKPVLKGQSTIPLTAEEQRAVATAVLPSERKGEDAEAPQS